MMTNVKTTLLSQVPNATRWSARGDTVGTAADVALWPGCISVSAPAVTLVIGVSGGDEPEGGSL